MDEARELTWLVEHAVPILLGPLLLFSWHPRLLRGSTAVPRRTPIALGVLTGLSIAYFVIAWRDGLEYQGWAHTVGVACLNAAAIVSAWCLLRQARRSSSFETTLAAHALIVGWFVGLAFPILGELP